MLQRSENAFSTNRKTSLQALHESIANIRTHCLAHHRAEGIIALRRGKQIGDHGSQVGLIGRSHNQSYKLRPNPCPHLNRGWRWVFRVKVMPPQPSGLIAHPHVMIEAMTEAESRQLK